MKQIINNSFLMIESVDFVSFPIGGTLSFSKQMMNTFKERICLVGIETGNDTVGKWVIKEIDNVSYNSFSFLRINKEKKSNIPLRLKSFVFLLIHLLEIRKLGVRKVFTRSPQLLFALAFFRWESLAFCFAGTENSVSLSKYKYLRFLGGLYERILFFILSKKVDYIFASADYSAINQTVLRSNDLLRNRAIKPLYTRYDERIFFVQDKKKCRQELYLSDEKKILVTIGRIAKVKGGKLICDSYQNLVNDVDCILIFVGDGEERYELEKKYEEYFLSGDIRITGHLEHQEVAKYINASDLVLVGSFYEGWSNSIIESLACGKNIVSTSISGASELIENGINGFVVKERDSIEYSKKIKEALDGFEDPNPLSLKKSTKYNRSSLKKDLLELWPSINEKN